MQLLYFITTVTSQVHSQPLSACGVQCSTVLYRASGYSCHLVFHDSSIFNLYFKCYWSQFLQNNTWDPFIRSIVVTNHYSRSWKQYTILDISILLPFLLSLFRCYVFLSVWHHQVKRCAKFPSEEKITWCCVGCSMWGCPILQ